MVHFHNSFKTLTFLYCFLPQDLFTYWDWWINIFFWCSFFIFWNLICATFYTQDVCACSVAQSCPTLCDPMDRSPPGSPVHGIFQARRLEWVAISYSRGSSRPRDQTHVSCISCFDIFFTQGALGKCVTKLQESQEFSLEWRHCSKAGGLESLGKCENIFSLEKMIRINHLLFIDGERGLFLSRGDAWCSRLCVRLAAHVICGEDFWVMNSEGCSQASAEWGEIPEEEQVRLKLLVKGPSQGP